MRKIIVNCLLVLIASVITNLVLAQETYRTPGMDRLTMEEIRTLEEGSRQASEVNWQFYATVAGAIAREVIEVQKSIVESTNKIYRPINDAKIAFFNNFTLKLLGSKINNNETQFRHAKYLFELKGAEKIDEATYKQKLTLLSNKGFPDAMYELGVLNTKNQDYAGGLALITKAADLQYIRAKRFLNSLKKEEKLATFEMQSAELVAKKNRPNDNYRNELVLSFLLDSMIRSGEYTAVKAHLTLLTPGSNVGMAQSGLNQLCGMDKYKIMLAWVAIDTVFTHDGLSRFSLKKSQYRIFEDKINALSKQPGNDRQIAGIRGILGDLYSNIRNDDYNPVKALPYYRLAADNNSPSANFNLGRWYRYGFIVDKDYLKAKSYFETALTLGKNEALIELADMYEFGLGVEKNLSLCENYLVEYLSTRYTSIDVLFRLQRIHSKFITQFNAMTTQPFRNQRSMQLLFSDSAKIKIVQFVHDKFYLADTAMIKKSQEATAWLCSQFSNKKLSFYCASLINADPSMLEVIGYHGVFFNFYFDGQKEIEDETKLKMGNYGFKLENDFKISPQFAKSRFSLLGLDDRLAKVNLPFYLVYLDGESKPIYITNQGDPLKELQSIVDKYAK